VADRLCAVAGKAMIQDSLDMPGFASTFVAGRSFKKVNGGETMKKLAVFLALAVMVSLGACSRGEDLNDKITVGTWRVSYISLNGDESTSLFYGYVFTFAPDGSAKVTRPNLPDATGTWNGHDNDSRLDLDFSTTGLIQRVVKDWVVDDVKSDEIFLHESGYPLNQLEFVRI
jgi:hypothetical protein